MNNAVILLLTISSVIFGSSLSLIFSNFISPRLPFQIFSKSIPGVDDQLIAAKTFDLADFGFTTLFALLFFVGNYLLLSFIAKKNKETDFLLTSAILVLFSFVIFIQTHFITYSGKQVLGLIFLLELIFLTLSFISQKGYKEILQNLKAVSPTSLVPAFSNGLLLGFLLLLILNQLTTIAVLPILVLIMTPLLFIAIISSEVLPQKLVHSFPGLIVLFSIFFPTDLTKLITLGFLVLIVWAAIYLSKKDLFIRPLFAKFIYPAAIVFLVVYNPTFYIGNFDSVEEGFFLGWIQRLIEGQSLYKDVAIYHPPLITWGMYLISQFTGFSLYSERLFLHLLQVLGAIIYFFFLKKLLNNTWIIVIIMVLFLSFTSTLVRNNVEIRTASSLLSLLFLFGYFQTKKVRYLLITGISAAIALFTSIETGLAAILTLFIALNLFPVNKFFSFSQIKTNVLLLGGLALGSLPFVATIFLQKGFFDFINQISFYASIFSKGYFNSPIERSISLSYFHWHIFNQYLSSNAFFWEASRLILVGCLIYFSAKWFIGRSLELREKYIFTTVLFGLILFRAALGRSDWYHLLFVLPIAIIVLGYATEKLSNYKPTVAALLAFALLFFFARPSVNSVFLESQFFKFQTYGKVFGEYNNYSFPRGSGILVGSEVDTKIMDSLVDAVQSKTSKQDTIFAYPWMPEIYFYADRLNATSFDTPYAFFSDGHQQKMINELKSNRPKLIVYNKEMNFGGLTLDSLPLVHKFILDNYEQITSYGPYQILEEKSY